MPFINRLRDERGASLVEYALLVALIAVVCVGGITLLGGSASQKLSESANGGRSPATFQRSCNGEQCSFTADWSTSTLHYMNYEWDFGDGTSQNAPYIVDHYFEGDKDKYTVVLTTTNGETGESTREKVTCTRDEWTRAITCN